MVYPDVDSLRFPLFMVITSRVYRFIYLDIFVNFSVISSSIFSALPWFLSIYNYDGKNTRSFIIVQQVSEVLDFSPSYF